MVAISDLNSETGIAKLTPGQSALWGFRSGARGTHTSRTIMLDELSHLLDAVPEDAIRDNYAHAVMAHNCLGKRTAATRKLSLQRLTELYALDPQVILFRVLRELWVRNEPSRPLLALLLALARDPLFRATATAVVRTPYGNEFARQSMKDALTDAVGDRLNEATLDKVVETCRCGYQQGTSATGTAERLATYYPVSPNKFVILSVLTFGLYEIYWFYKNWAFIRERDRSDIWPWARALFAPLTYYSLRADVFEGRGIPGGIALSYFLLNAAWRLPDPFWYLAFLTFVPLLPSVNRINELNVVSVVEGNSAWKPRHALLALFAVPVLSLNVALSSGLIPNSQVVSGSRVWGPSLAFMENSRIIEPDEQILYFYAAGLLSFADDGNILTDRRVISYYTDPQTGELFVESATFAEITDIQTETGNWIDPTIVTVTREDGVWFQLFLGTEGQGDERFIERLAALTPLR